MKYYTSENDYVYYEDESGKVYSYNYKTKSFQPYPGVIDIMKWHEFDPADLPKMIKINEHLFK